MSEKSEHALTEEEKRIREFDIMPISFDDLVWVGMVGKKKYGGGIDWERFINDGVEDNIASIKRHILERRLGVLNDEDNIHPMLKVAFRAMMQYHVDLVGKEKVLEDFLRGRE